MEELAENDSWVFRITGVRCLFPRGHKRFQVLCLFYVLVTGEGFQHFQLWMPSYTVCILWYGKQGTIKHLWAGKWHNTNIFQQIWISGNRNLQHGSVGIEILSRITRWYSLLETILGRYTKVVTVVVSGSGYISEEMEYNEGIGFDLQVSFSLHGHVFFPFEIRIKSNSQDSSCVRGISQVSQVFLQAGTVYDTLIPARVYSKKLLPRLYHSKFTGEL